MNTTKNLMTYLFKKIKIIILLHKYYLLINDIEAYVFCFEENLWRAIYAGHTNLLDIHDLGILIYYGTWFFK